MQEDGHSSDVLVIGPDTDVGRKVVRRLAESERDITVFVPAKKYTNFHHDKQIAIDFRDTNSIRSAFLLFKVVVQCNAHSTPEIESVAQSVVETDFIRATMDDSEAIISSFELKFPVGTKNMCSFAHVCVADAISHSGYRLIGKPRIFDKMPVLEVYRKSGPRFFLYFSSYFSCVLFWIISFFLHHMGARKKSSASDWIFTCEEDVDEGRSFTTCCRVVDVNGLKCDLAIYTAMKTLRKKGGFSFFGGLQCRVKSVAAR